MSFIMNDNFLRGNFLMVFQVFIKTKNINKPLLLRRMTRSFAPAFIPASNLTVLILAKNRKINDFNCIAF